MISTISGWSGKSTMCTCWAVLSLAKYSKRIFLWFLSRIKSMRVSMLKVIWRGRNRRNWRILTMSALMSSPTSSYRIITIEIKCTTKVSCFPRTAWKICQWPRPHPMTKDLEKYKGIIIPKMNKSRDLLIISCTACPSSPNTTLLIHSSTLPLSLWMGRDSQQVAAEAAAASSS